MDRSPANYLVTVKGNYSLFKSLLDLLTCIELKAQSIFVTKFKKKKVKIFYSIEKWPVYWAIDVSKPRRSTEVNLSPQTVSTVFRVKVFACEIIMKI